MSDGHDNLIPVNKRTKEEARDISQKGGKASGEARRKKRDLKEKIKAYFETLDDSGMDNETKIIVKLGQRAAKGDVAAAKELWDRMDGKAKQTVEQSNYNLNVTPEEEEILKQDAKDKGIAWEEYVKIHGLKIDFN